MRDNPQGRISSASAPEGRGPIEAKSPSPPGRNPIGSHGSLQPRHVLSRHPAAGTVSL
jgi:hypothetical protein